MNNDIKLKKPLVVACIPAYNEEMTIAKVVIQAQRYVDKVIVCDDGSTDLTGEIAERLGAEVIKHERNMGKGVALRDLFKMAIENLNADLIVALDADGQHDPNEIPKLLEPLKVEEADFTIGSREWSEVDAPLYRRLGLRIINLISRRSMKSTIKDTQSGFRAFTREALEKLINVESRGFSIETEQVSLALKTGLRVKEVPISIKYKGLPRTSKKNPLLHGGEVIATMIRLIVAVSYTHLTLPTKA